MAVFAGGGHTTETSLLVRHLGDDADYVYVMIKGDSLSPHKEPFPGREIYIPPPGRTWDDPFTFLFRSIFSLFASLVAVASEKPDIIVSVGKDITVPIFIAGKIFGSKTVFVESMQRVYLPSLTGRIVYRIADLFFVQWPEMKKRFPRAIYAGRLA